jgi:hypothetical protein
MVKAQTFSEWFRQKKTQIKYLISQIAALEVYDSYLNKGYSIAQNALTSIYDFKKGEFNLHNAFFSSLKAINPDVAKYGRIADIISYQQAIIRNFKQILQTKNMSASEMSYLQSVYNNMTGECTKSLNELIGVITADTYTMKDDERVKRIDAIYDDMKDKYAFSQSFSSEAKLLANQRTSDQNEINMSLINNGLK